MDTSSPKNFNIYFEFIIFLNEFKNKEGMEEVLPWKEKWPIGIGVWNTHSRVVPPLILLRR